MFKVGDLVHLKRRVGRSKPHEIWLVLGEGVDKVGYFKDYVRVQSVNTGETCQYNSALLQHFKTDKI